MILQSTNIGWLVQFTTYRVLIHFTKYRVLDVQSTEYRMLLRSTMVFVKSVYLKRLLYKAYTQKPIVGSTAA